MASQSVLVVAGRIDPESNQEKLSKLLYDGLLAAFGEDLDKLDAQFLNCLAKPVNAIDSKEYGLTSEYILRENVFIRVLFNPTSDQLRFGLQEALSHMIVNNNSVVEYPVTPSTLGKVCMVYNGQLHGFTGDWLLQDSSFSGNNLLLWLNSEEAMSWWPHLKKFSNFGDQIKLHIITPIAGTGTCWPVDKSGRPHTVLTQINTRMAKIDILVEASWRLNGKPLNTHGNLSGFEGLRSFVDHIIHQHPMTAIQSDLNSLTTGTALNTTRPVIYVFPGHGVASQSCALFAIQGFTALLGGSYTSQTIPNWWSMVKHLPKLDVSLLPDWCPSSILTYRFMTELLKSEQDSIGILGEILVPPGNNSSTEGLSDISTGLILTPPSLISGPHEGTWASSSNTTNDTIPSSVVLYSKLGWGELKLQPLSHRSGLLLIWESVVHDFTSHQPLCIVMPSVQPTNTNPVQNLARFIKGLCQIPQLSGPTSNRTIKSAVKPGAKQLVRGQPARPSKPISHATGQKETITSKTTNSTMNAKPSPMRPISSTPNHNQRAAPTTPSKTPSLSVNQLKKSVSENTTNSKLMNNSHGVDSHQKRPLSSVDTKKSFNASKPLVTTTKPVNGELKTTTRPLSGPKTTPLGKPKTTTTTAERLTAHSNLVNQHGSKAPSRKSEPTTHLANKLQTKKASSLNVVSNRVPSAKPIKEESETIGKTTELVNSSLPPVTLQNISLNNELTSVDPMLNSLMKSSIHENSGNHLDNLSPTNQFVITDNQRIISTGTSLQKEEEEPQEVVKQPQHEVEEKEEEYKVHKVLKENQMLAEESDEQLAIDLECELKPSTPLSCDDSLAEGEELEEEEEQEEQEHEVLGKEMNSFDISQYEQNQVTKEGIVSSLGFPDMQSYKTPFDTPFDVDMTESPAVFETDINKSVGNSVVIEQHEPQYLEQKVEDELNRNVDIEDNETYVNYLQEESLPFTADKQSLVESSHDAKYLTETQETGQNDDIFESGFNVNNVLKEQQVVELNEENYQDEGEQQQLDEEFNLDTRDLSYEKEDIIDHRYDNSLSILESGLSPLTNKTLKSGEQMSPCSDNVVVTTPGEMDNSFDKIQSQQPIEEGGYYEQIKQYPDENEMIQMEGREKLINYSMDHSQDELSPFHAETDVDANVTTDLMPDFTESRSSNLTEQPDFKEEEESGNLDEYEIHYQPRSIEETSNENIQDVQCIHREQITEHFNDIINQLQDQLSPSVFEKEVVEEPHELLQSSNNFNTEQKVIGEAEENEIEPKIIDSNKIEEVNIIGSSDFLTEVIPLSDDKNNLHFNQPYSYVPENHSLQNDDDDNDNDYDELTKSSRTDVVKAVDNEPVYNQTHINLITDEQTYLTHGTKDEKEEQVTNLDNIQYRDDVIDHSFQPYNIQTHAHLDEENEEENLEKSSPELLTKYEENYLSKSIKNCYEQKHEQCLPDQETHIEMNYLQLDQHKPIEETNSDIDEMEKEFVIPYQQKQINTEYDESFLSHTNIDDNNMNDGITTDDYNRTMNSHEIHSHQNIELEVENVSLEHDITNAQDDEMIPDNSLLSMATNYPSDPTKYQVDSSTDQIINTNQTLEGFSYNNHHLSNETDFAIQRKVEASETDEESYQKVDSTTYEESHFISHDIHNDVDSRVDINSDSYQEPDNSLHVDTETNVEGHHQQQFISPDSEISENSTIQMQQHHDEHVQECEHQQDEQHSEADLLISSPNRSVSPNYNIVSSTQQHSNEEEEDKDYVGDDIVVYHNDAVIMNKESEIDLHQDQHYQQFDVDEKLLNNSTLNRFSNYSNSVHQQHHVYSEIPTDDSAETMMPRMTMMMSTNVDVNNNNNNNNNNEITNDTTTTTNGNSHVNLEQQYFNGNTIYQTNDNLNDIDHSMHITPTTNHHLQDSDSAYTNGYNVVPNGNHFSNLKASDINEDENQDESHQNQWNKSNTRYLSETDIDDINFSNFCSKNLESEYMKAAHMTHSCHGEENEEHSYMIMTTTPPPSATSTTTATPSKDMENFGKFFVDKDQFLHDINQNTSPHCSPTEETFDPLKTWGHPLGLPAPVPPITNHSKLHQQTNLTKRVRSADTSGKTLTTDDSTLPPGPPVYLDVIWVPSYLVRVPQSLMVEFFIRVRAKLYILSGEALHPNIAEALITAKTKWNPDDVPYLCRCDANSPDASITILPTDEPKEWIRWLETPCGRLDEQKGSDRLKANHFRLLPAANLCSTQFNAGDTIFECEGLRVEL